MMHPDGTPYWEYTPQKKDARASLIWVESTGILYSKGGTYIMTGTLDECANRMLTEVINIEEDY